MTIEPEIETFVLHFLGVEAPLDAACRYIEEGRLDSMALMNLVVALEERFDVELTDEDIVSDEFRTLGGLVAIVAEAGARRALAS